MSRIKNWEKWNKEELTIILLISESSATERNFEKRFNFNTDHDDTYDDKIRGKICEINMILSRLGKIVTKMIEIKLKESFMK